MARSADDWPFDWSWPNGWTRCWMRWIAFSADQRWPAGNAKFRCFGLGSVGNWKRLLADGFVSLERHLW